MVLSCCRGEEASLREALGEITVHSYAEDEDELQNDLQDKKERYPATDSKKPFLSYGEEERHTGACLRV